MDLSRWFSATERAHRPRKLPDKPVNEQKRSDAEGPISASCGANAARTGPHSRQQRQRNEDRRAIEHHRPLGMALAPQLDHELGGGLSDRPAHSGPVRTITTGRRQLPHLKTQEAAHWKWNRRCVLSADSMVVVADPTAMPAAPYASSNVSAFAFVSRMSTNPVAHDLGHLCLWNGWGLLD